MICRHGRSVASVTDAASAGTVVPVNAARRSHVMSNGQPDTMSVPSAWRENSLCHCAAPVC